MGNRAVPEEEQLSELEYGFSRRGLLLRYADGRVRSVYQRQGMALLGGIALMLADGPARGLLVIALALFGETVDCFVLKRVSGWLDAGVSFRKIYALTTLTAGLQAVTIGYCVWLCWHGPQSQYSHLFSLAFMLGAVVNGGLVLPFHRVAGAARLSVYGATLLSVLVSSWFKVETNSAGFWMDALGALVLIYIVYMFLSYIVAGFGRHRRNTLDLIANGRALVEREQEARRLSLVARNANDSVILSDKDNRIFWVNDAFTRVTGYPIEEAIGQTPGELLNGPETDPKTIAAIKNACSIGMSFRGEVQNVTRDGRRIWVETNQVPVLGDNGQVEMTVAVERDVTAARNYANEMARAKRAAEDGARAKSEFLATMSHEIRTPMNGVIGMTDMLESTSLTPEQHMYVGTIRSSAQALVAIINDILDMSKLEVGKMVLHPVPFDLRACVEQTVLLLGPQARSKGLSLDLDLAENLPDRVCGDDVRLRQILLNLIGNAVKFTRTGGVDVAVSSAQSDETHLVTIRIVDTGIGIAADRLGDIFDEFVQADAATTREFGGTGLGLTIARKLVEAMGGKVSVDSQLGKGTCFSVDLPFDAGCCPESVADERRDFDTENLAGIRVLLAEDNKVNRLLTKKYLSDLPIELQFAHDGSEAVNMARDWQPHLVFMDMSMPIMSGIEATEQIRCLPIYQPRIVALTANAFESDKEACKAAGMDDFLTKPVRRADLIESLYHHCVAVHADFD
jgi:PAS domain S-box-containing protein